jgi:cytochrome c peroxidase
MQTKIGGSKHPTIGKTMVILLLVATALLVMDGNNGFAASVPAIGNPKVLEQRFAAFTRQADKNPDSALLTLTLVPPVRIQPPGGLEAVQTTARGIVHFDFSAGRLTARLSGVPQDVKLELSFSDTSQLDAQTERAKLKPIGTFRQNGDSAELDASLSDLDKLDFDIGLILVSAQGTDSLKSPVLLASPTLFQKLYFRERLMKSTVRTASPSQLSSGIFTPLVVNGEDIFFNETFAGNGRSCGTCHPETNNLTIDPDFIATLPPNDPLFVAENVPALIFGNPANLDGGGMPQRFENPALMRAFGLILENVDGMGDLQNRFEMRGVPHTFSQAVSILTPPSGLTPPDDRTGWSGDGSPLGLIGGVPVSGRLRDFAVGAVLQHFPQTPARNFGGASPDFRVPTATELDALEAFMLSLGRLNDIEIRSGFPNTLVLKDADAEAGKVLFRDGSPPGSVTCQNCHGNAGANVLGGTNPGNRNFNTGIELFLRNRINDPQFTVVGEPRPVDGGFGLNPAGDFTAILEQPGFNNENFGDLTFNTPSLVEAADTPPFFHNDIMDNLEDAIGFFNSPEFQASTGVSIPFTDSQVAQVAQFLRVINTIDNIENAILRATQRALDGLNQNPNPEPTIQRILEAAIADTDDCIDVLNEGGLHNTGGNPVNAVMQLERARMRFNQAMNSSAADRARINHLNKATDRLNQALNIMRF